ncbi:MAG: hypothetical protein AABY64_14765 [Bdellovibrionota bacterium]
MKTLTISLAKLAFLGFAFSNSALAATTACQALSSNGQPAFLVYITLGKQLAGSFNTKSQEAVVGIYGPQLKQNFKTTFNTFSVSTRCDYGVVSTADIDAFAKIQFSNIHSSCGNNSKKLQTIAINPATLNVKLYNLNCVGGPLKL